MSDLSKILKKSFGIPEVNLLKKDNPVLGELMEKIVEGQLDELFEKLPDTALAAVGMAWKEETRRRLEA